MENASITNSYFLKQLINNKIDFVSGSRFLKKDGYKSNPLIR